MSGVVDGIYIAGEASGSMVEQTEAQLVAGRGIVGDRYAKRKGTYSVFRQSKKDSGMREPGRQLTIVAAEGIEAAFITNGLLLELFDICSTCRVWSLLPAY